MENVEQVHAVIAATTSGRARSLHDALARSGIRCELVLPDGSHVRCGDGPPLFRAHFRTTRALASGLDEFQLGKAYVEGEIDLEGDLFAVFDVRDRLRDGAPWAARLGFLRQLLRTPAKANRDAIDFHYTLGDDFYHSFIDTRFHFYSHCLFHDDGETLEEAAEHKLETMFEALGLQPGMRLLDIGGGWGGVTRYCGARGIHVTSLTIAKDSYEYISNILRTENLPGEVRLEDFLNHRPSAPYDAIVIYGVIEHIPNYRRFCERAWECLVPGGRLYMDASASKQKFDMSAFTRHYIWHGTHTFLALQDMVGEFLLNGFEVVEVKQESHDYELTMRHWAERFDRHRDNIAARWGEKVYRAFRIYLWGGCHAFHRDRLQAYHLVAQRGRDRGPRPGRLRRLQQMALGLRG